MCRLDPASCRLFLLLSSLIFCAPESGRAAADRNQEDEQPGEVSGLDPSEPPETRIRLTPFLTFGAQLEAEYEHQTKLDLDGAANADLSLAEPGLALAFSFDPSSYFQAFVEVNLAEEWVFEDPDQQNDRLSLESEQAYVLFKNLLNERLALQLGRQRFEDERQWLYDEELDALRAFFKLSNVMLELSASREGLADRDFLNGDEPGRINNYVAYGSCAIAEELNAAAYVVARDDRSPEENSPFIVGLHSDGELTNSIEYWLEAAHARGKDGASKVRGYGFDIGAKYEFALGLRPSITLGFALGTGDGNPDDGVDKSFRQTGLQNNEDDFKYYGELFDPELSNLSILTLSAGLTPTEESFVDLVYHDYRQHKAADNLRDAGIDADPQGVNKRLGREIDLIIGYEGRRLELAFNFGYFIPGNAFAPDAEKSFLTRLEMQFGF